MKIIIGILIGIVFYGHNVFGTVKAETKAPVRLYLEHFRNNEIRRLSVRVLTRKDKRYRPAAGIEVLLYTSEIAPSNLLGKLVTAEKGIGTYTMTPAQFDAEKSKKIAKYIAVVNENDSLQGKKAEVIIKDVNLDVRFEIVDSVKMVYAHVSETDSIGNEIPQSGVALKFLVDRPLSPLPIGDEYNQTDEEGNASVEFPDDLPGDKDGNLKILVRIVESEDYGTVEVSSIKPWGIPTVVDEKTEKRSLWASGANAPITLLIFINSLIIGVWGIIFYIIYNILKIRKIGEGSTMADV